MAKLLFQFENIIHKQLLFWVSLGLFVFIPAYPKFPLLNIPGTYVAVRIEDILIAFSMLMLLLALIPQYKKLKNESITQAIILYWLVGALSLFAGVFLTHTVHFSLGIFHLLRRIETMGLFFLCWFAFKNIGQLKLWMKVMLIATLFIVLYGFGQQYLNFPVVSTTNKEFSKGLILYLTSNARVNSTFAGHYDLAIYLMVFLIFSAASFMYFKKILHKVIIIAISILSFVLLAMTAARVSFFAAVLGIALVLWYSNKRKLIIILAVLVLAAFAISPELRHRTVATLTVNLLEGGGPKYTPPPSATSSGKAFSIEFASPSATFSGVPVDVAPGEPLNTTELGVYRSYGIRLDVEWPRAIRAFYKDPLLGTGYSSISIASDNDFLRALGETGLLGFVSMALVWFIVVKKLYKYFILQTKDLLHFIVLGLLVSLVTIFLNAFVIDILESSKVAELLWMIMGMTYALIDNKADQNLNE